MKTFSLTTFPLRGKTIFVRVDFNVPLEKGKVSDNHKIKASVETIHFLMKQQCKVILATHLGDPKGKATRNLSTICLLPEVQKVLPMYKITFLPECIGKEVKERIYNIQKKEILLLENLRFHKEEEENDPAFAHALASLADIYINEAFSACHRKHASIDAITLFLPSIPGCGTQKEIASLRKLLQPSKPAVWIMGGGKIAKMKLLEQVLTKADIVLIGGALAFPFMKATGISIGMSKADSALIESAQKMLRLRIAKKLLFPLDFVVANEVSSKAKTSVVPYTGIKADHIALDVGPQTVELYKQYLRQARTIVWNGPLGYFELAPFATATKEIARTMENINAFKIIGGGETADAIHKFHLEHNFTHISTGGGATLSFLSGEKLPGISALETNYKKWKKRFIL